MNSNFMYRAVFLFILLAGMLLSSQAVFADNPDSRIHPYLQELMKSSGDEDLIPVYIMLKDRLSLDYLRGTTQGLRREDRRQEVVRILKEHAAYSQSRVLSYLEDKKSQELIGHVENIWSINVIAFKAKSSVIEELARDFQEIEEIRYDRPISSEEAVDDNGISKYNEENNIILAPTFSPQPGLTLINAPAVWAEGDSGQGVIVANVDGGTDWKHPDLIHNIWNNLGEDADGDGHTIELSGSSWVFDPGDVNGVDDDSNGKVDDFIGWNFSNNTNDPSTASISHGTSTAGIVAGDGTNGTETGVAPRAKLMNLNINTGGESVWWSAYQYAFENGANVTTSSFSAKWGFSPQPNYPMFRQTNDMELAAGVLHTNSTSNDGNSYGVPFNISAPGNSPGPWIHPDQTLVGGISSVVGAANVNASTDIIVSSSPYGPWAWEDYQINHPSYPYPVPLEYQDYPYETQPGSMGLLKPDVAAPGEGTTSTVPGGGYSSFGGTSGATPHVAGTAALILSINPNLEPEDVSRILQTTAVEKGDPGKDNRYGAGRIDAYAAYQQALSELSDPADPNPPTNVSAYSDYTTPTSMLLQWDDPTTLFNGDPLNPGDFTIEIERDTVNVASVAGGIGQYTDTNLNDGQLYTYVLQAQLIANDSTSIKTNEVCWTAGGSPVPGPPNVFSITTASGGQLMAHWTNPSENVDGTPMDDFDAINLYEDGSLVTTFTRSPADTGSADSALFTPGGANLPYYVTAMDNESPSNESAASNTAYPPFVAPYSQDFEAGGALPVQWTNEQDDDFDWTVNAGGTSSTGTGPTVDHTTGTASGFYMYTEASTPNFPNMVAHLTTPFIDLGTVSLPGMAFWYHMYGAAMGELHVDVYANGMWNLDVMAPLVGQQQLNQTDPWLQAVVDLSAYSGAPIQVRFRGITGSSFTSDMAIDDVFFGSLAANPNMTVAPLAISDTLLVGAASMHTVTVSNLALLPTALNYTVIEDPVASWLNVLPASGTLTSGQSDSLSVSLDASGLTAGIYNADLIVAGNDTANDADTVGVTLQVNDAPVISIAPDTFDVTVDSGAVAVDSLTIRNSGLGPLTFTVGPAQPAKRAGSAKVDEATLSAPVLAAMKRRTAHRGVVNAIEETQQNSSVGGMLRDQIQGEEIFGSTANPFTGTLRDRGNIFSVSTATTLIEHRFYLSIPTDDELRFFVYRGTSVIGTYNKIDEVHFASSGTGEGFYSSGPINVPLEVGFYYYIGAAWPGNNTYYRGSETTPLPTSFGMLETGIPGNIAGGFPPGATATNNTYTGYSPYYCAIVTGVGIDWISANPEAGQVAPGDSMDVELTFDPTGLENGDYYADVLVSSNDPVNPEMRAGVHMLVSGVTGIMDDPSELPKTFAVSPNYPNPFNPSTTIKYQLPQSGDVNLTIYNVLGQRVRALVDARIEAGYHSIEWDGRNDAGAQVASGIYIYRFSADNYLKVQKMILMK